MGYCVKYICISEIGKCRSDNQDNFTCDGQYLQEGVTSSFPITGTLRSDCPGILGVFDGMGGEQCGDVAARIAARTAARYTFFENAEESLRQICDNANEEICRYVRSHNLRAMGTTAAMILFGNNGITICNVGDSRIYLISDYDMKQISEDHIAEVHYSTKPLLTQNLGMEGSVEPYIASGYYIEGDKYLLCSDGLTDMLTEEEIRKIVLQYSLRDAARHLVDTAMDHGGKDNITVILCEIQKKKNLFQIFQRT